MLMLRGVLVLDVCLLVVCIWLVFWLDLLWLGGILIGFDCCFVLFGVCLFVGVLVFVVGELAAEFILVVWW